MYPQGNYRLDNREDTKFNQGYISGQGQGGSGALDTFGTTEGLFGTGGKGKAMQEILTNSGTKFTPGQGYNLNWWQRNVDKITDQDVYNARKSREVDAMRAKYGDDAELLGVKIDGTTSRVDLARNVKEAKLVEGLSQDLRKMTGGTAVLAKLKTGGNLNSADLEGAITTLTKTNEINDPLRKLSIEAGKAGIKRGENQDQIAASTLAMQVDSKKFQERMYAEQQKNRFEDKRESRADKALQRSEGAANRAAMMKLKMYEVDAANAARADEFEYRREKDRLLKHQQLVASFTNLAAAFAV